MALLIKRYTVYTRWSFIVDRQTCFHWVKSPTSQYTNYRWSNWMQNNIPTWRITWKNLYAITKRIEALGKGLMYRRKKSLNNLKQ